MAKNLALLEVLHTQFPVEMNIFPLTRLSLCIKFYFRETLSVLRLVSSMV